MVARASSQPFAGTTVYFSGSIHGIHQGVDIAADLIQFMIAGGADVPSAHVGAASAEERNKMLAARTNYAFHEDPEPWFAVRERDALWVDEASHVVAVVNGPSHGVGMEIERALLKPERGLNATPILCLVQYEFLNGLSYMIRGLRHAAFRLETYVTVSDAQQLVTSFLTNTLTA